MTEAKVEELEAELFCAEPDEEEDVLLGLESVMLLNPPCLVGT